MKSSIAVKPTVVSACSNHNTARFPQELTNTVFNEDCMLGLSRIPDKSVHMVLTDIPYGECNSFAPGLRNLNKGKADKVTFELRPFIRAVDKTLAPSGSFYAFVGQQQVSEAIKELKELGYSTRLCVWEKTNPSPMNGKVIWLSSIEACVFGKKPGATFNEHCAGVVWKFPVGRSKRHPTEKPLRLMEYLISVSSNPGDIILDPCLGSGTTAEAASNLGRNYVGFEIDTEYCALARERLSNTGRLSTAADAGI
ncbi:MAG: site-specific DNA-methyltransferase [Thiobacillus sp.]|nr:site-specific DNA-methyltransferase [Thiobacillus sp.]